MSLTRRLKSALPFLGEDKDKARRTAKPTTTAPPASAQPIAGAYAPVDSDRTLPAQINSAASNATCVATRSGHNGSLDKQYQAFLKSVDTPAASGGQAAANGSSSASPWDSVAPSRSARSPNAPDAKSPAPAHDDGASVFLQIPGRTRDDASESVSPAPERAQGHQDPFSIGEMLAATKSASQGATATSAAELHGSFAVVGGDAAARDAEEDEAMQNAVAAAFANVDDDDAPAPQPRVSSTPAAVAPPECPPGAVAYPQYAAAPAGYVAAAPAPVYWVQAAAPAAPAVAAAPAASRAPPSYQAHQKAQGPSSYGGYTPVTSGRLKDEKEDRKEPKKHSGPTTAPTKSTFASQPPPKPSFRKPEPKPMTDAHATEEATADHAASIAEKKIPDTVTAVETKAAGVDTHSKTDVVVKEEKADARGITITQAAPTTEAPKHDERATEGTALPGGVVPPGYILVPASQMEGKPSKDSEDDESKAQPVQPVQPTPSAAPAPPVAGAAAPHPYAHMQHMPPMQMMPVAPAAYAQPSYIPMMTATGQTVLVPAAPVPPQPTPGAPAGYAMVPVPVAPGAPLPAGAVSYTPSAHQQPVQPPAASVAEKMPPPPYTFGASKPPSVAPPPPAPPAHGPLPQEYLDAQRRVGEKKYAELQKRQAGEAVDDDRVMPMSTDAGPRQLIINYLPDPVTEEELEAMFEIYGEIEVVRVIYNRATGRTKGYGFVYFAKSKDAAVAVAKLNGLALFGKRLKVAFADEQREE